MNDQHRFWLGVALVVGLFSLGAVIALGKVSEQTSYGLREILAAICVLTGGFANWAFGGRAPSTPPSETEKK